MMLAVLLELVVALDRYRESIRLVKIEPENDASWKAGSAALRRAGTLAFTSPEIWPFWSELILRHSTLFETLIAENPAIGLEDAWARADDYAETVTRHCIIRARAVQPTSDADRFVVDAFEAWDVARREAFRLGRRILSMPEREFEPSASDMDELRLCYAEASVKAARLLARAIVALRGLEFPGPGEGDKASEYESLHAQWSVAEQAASAAEIAVIELQLQKLPVPSEQRRRAAQLRNAASFCRQAVLGAVEL